MNAKRLKQNLAHWKDNETVSIAGFMFSGTFRKERGDLFKIRIT